MTAYMKNQLVWAKVKGYPWWPATIARPNQSKNGTVEGRVLVNFVGEKTHATVALDKIADYDEKFKQYSSIKSKKLQEAVKAAQRRLDGFSSEEESSDDEEDEKLTLRLKRKASRDSSSVKSLRRNRAIDSADEDEDEDEEEEDKRRVVKTGRLGSKIREKEIRAIKRNKSPIEKEAGRFTRSRSKTSKIEMLTEPLIYTSRKSSKTPPPMASLSPGKRNNSKRKDSENAESTKANKPARTPARQTIKTKLIVSTKMIKTEEKIDLENESVITTTNSDENDGLQAKKNALDAENNSNELNMMLQDVDENDDSESFQLNEDSIPEEDLKKTENSKVAPNKRPALGHLEGLGHQKGNGQTDQADRKYLTGYIIKKVKPNDQETGQTRIKRIENSLQQILNELSAQIKTNEPLDEKNLAEYMKTIQEIESCQDLTGAELISSELGKLTKTLHFLLSRNAHLLCETGQALTVSLAKILHKIKSNILKFCLDNTNYIETFQLTDEQEKTSDKKYRVIDIESEETKICIDSRPQHILELDKNNSSLTTAMDDEDTSKFQRTIIETITSPSLNKDDSVIVSPGICKPEAAPATKLHKEEEEHKKHEGVTDFQLRKKICQKFTALLQKSYGLEKEKSNELTRKIESRIINNYGEDVNDYKQAIKQLLKLIKADLLKIDDLNLIHNMSIPEFKEMMDEKLKLLEDDTEGSEVNSSLPNNRKKKETRKEVIKEAEDDEDNSEEAPRRTTRATGKTLSKPELEEQLIKKSVSRRKSVKKEGAKGSKGASRLRSGRRY